ncbi:MAG: T9SS type A sorting domain-containing protein [Bacteroidaceae bacterium]|nr:T9SS type A sorting domain-containing protein [Bacteroidaceae bacterium]
MNAVILTFSSALGKTVSGAYRTTLTTGEDNLIEIPVASISSLDKREKCPLTFKGINLNTGKITDGTAYHLSVKLIEAIYSAIEANVDGIAPVLASQGEVTKLKMSGQQLLLSAPAAGPTDIQVYSPCGQLVTVIHAVQGATTVVFPSAIRPGIYLLRTSNASASAGTKLLVP